MAATRRREVCVSFDSSLLAEVTKRTTTPLGTSAPYVTTDAKETLVTNYISVIKESVTEW
jgi:hypothetical protein